MVAYSLTAGSPKEFTQLGPSRDRFTEVEVNGFRHLHCLAFYNLSEAEKISDRESLPILIPTRSMTNQPGDDRSSVLLVPDVEIQEARRDASFFACLLAGIVEHGRMYW